VSDCFRDRHGGISVCPIAAGIVTALLYKQALWKFKTSKGLVCFAGQYIAFVEWI
jgi:hypothetical protein